jgi:phage-related minor tail protein
MADFNLGDAELTTSVNLDGLADGLDEAKGMAEREGANAGSLLGAGLSAGVAAAGAAVALAVGATIASAVGFASEQAQAVNLLQAQLGLTADEAAALGSVAEDVFLNNFGGSITEATEAIGNVRQQLGDLPANELQAVTEGAFAISDAFGQELPGVVNAAKSLMTDFGLTSTEAMDFIAQGFQQGLDSSGDFLDSIGEYAPQFGNSGFAASEFFSAMQTGLQGGMLGTDKAADAFKEFGLRIMAAGDDIIGPDGALRGLMPDGEISRIWEGLEDGSVTVADAFNAIMPVMAGMDNQVHQNSLGVALFGTQWEDMGASAMLSLDLTATSMADMTGATDSLNIQYASLGAVWETVTRQMLVTIAPLGEMLLQIANMAMPYVLAAFEQFRLGVELAITTVTGWISAGVATISTLLAGDGTSSVNNWAAAYEGVKTFITGYIEAIQSVITTIIGAVAAFWAKNGDDIMAFTQSAWEQIGRIVTMAMELINAIVIPLWTTIANFISNNQGTIVTILDTAWANIKTIVQAAMDIVESIISIALGLISGDWDRVWEGIKTVTSTVIETVKTVVENNLNGMRAIADTVLDAMKTAFMNQFGGILDAVTGLAGRAMSAGESFINSIRDGIMGAIDGLIAEARAALQELADLLPGSEPKDPTSPLRGLAARGEAIATNMIPGLESGMGDLTGAMRDGLSATADATTRSTEINVTAQYGYQPERRVRDDIRLLQLMSETA